MVVSRDDLPPAGLLLTVCSGLPPTGGLAAALCMGFVTELMRRGVLLVDLFKQDLYRVVIPVNSVQSIDHNFPLPIGSWQAYKRLYYK